MEPSACSLAYRAAASSRSSRVKLAPACSSMPKPANTAKKTVTTANKIHNTRDENASRNESFRIAR